MKAVPLPLLGGCQGPRTDACDLFMTSLLLGLLTALLLPSPVSGEAETQYNQGIVKNCYSGEKNFATSPNCSFPDEGKDSHGACCSFIFSFGDVPSQWKCASYDMGNYDELCQNVGNNTCGKYEKDVSGRSIRCVCWTPLCNTPDHWLKDPVFRAWRRHPGNRKWKDANNDTMEEEGKEGTTPNPGTGTTGDEYGGVASIRGNLATVAALLVIGIPALRLSSASVVLLTFGLTFLLLPSTVSGESQTREDLTCLSSSNATEGWGDQHCGRRVATCCYYIFQEIPNWGCANPSTCEKRWDARVGYTVCKEHWDGDDRPPVLLCHCNRNSCNHPEDHEEWEEDPLYRWWKRQRDAEATTVQGAEGTTPSTKGPGGEDSSGAGGRAGGSATFLALLKALYDIIF